MKVFNRLLMTAAGFLFIVSISGCTMFNFKGTAAEQKNGTQVKKVGENLLKTFVDNDAKGFLKLLPEIVSTEFGTQGFKKTRESMIEQLGVPISYTFVLNLEHPTFTVSIWKIRFKRENFEKTKTIYQEALFRAVSGKMDGQERLLGFNFF